MERVRQIERVHDERIDHRRDESKASSVERRTGADLHAGTGTAALRFAGILNAAIFTSLLFLIALTAVPYGTVEPWWKAVFVCFVFVLCIFAIIEYLLDPSGKLPDRVILTPLLILAGFALLQSFALSSESNAVLRYRPWNAISADPYQTQFFVLQLLAVTLAGALFYRYASSDRRVGILVNVIIGVAVASAIFGVVRQTNQHGLGFGLPLLQPAQGYGQFINPHHFALLMEMAFGLTVGMVLGGGAKREWNIVYLASVLIIWPALVLANSRGGLLAMLAQIFAAGLLFTVVVPASSKDGTRYRIFRGLRSLPVRIGLLSVLCVAVIFGTLWVGGDRLAGRLGQIGEDVAATRNRTGGNRNEIWRATWQMFKAHSIAGVGLGGYWIAIPAYHDASGALTPQEAHNEYLELLSSGGIIGGAIGLWFLYVVTRRIQKSMRSSNHFRRAVRYGAVLGLVGVAVHSLLDFGLHMMVNALVCAALVVIATRKVHSESKHRRMNA